LCPKKEHRVLSSFNCLIALTAGFLSLLFIYPQLPLFMIKHSLLLLLLSIIITGSSFAQKRPAFDTSYIQDRTQDFLLRIYGSNKFTRLTIGDYDRPNKLLYKPNSNYNVGFGFNYRWLGINIGFKTPGINNDNDKRGKSAFLDLQAYAYMRNLTIDFYGQTYEGYYLANDDILQQKPVGRPYFLRNDIQTRNLGANVEYLFNGKRFSYRAVYNQNERQLRSAGSFIAGAGLHYHHVRADSSLIPPGVDYAVFAGNRAYNRSGIASLVVNGGYAHTFVFARNFFITGSLVAGAGVNYTRLIDERADREDNGTRLQINGIARLGGGYNSGQYFVGAFFTTNLSHSNLPAGSGYQSYETGLVRVMLARRFVAPRVVAKTFDRLERIINK
jgi:hypothetical protein